MSKPQTLSAFHVKNIPSHHLNEDGTLPDTMQVRKVGVVSLVTEGSDQNYYYLGRRFYQDSGTPKGYYGRFKMGSKHGTSTMAEMVSLIDNLNRPRTAS